MFELDKWGADIFVRNRENKTCFQVVNNNLLMLKIVKQLERKYFVSTTLSKEWPKICPEEFKILLYNNILLNSGEYKQFKGILQKIKKDNLRKPSKNNSIFNRNNKSRPPSAHREPLETQ